MERVVPSSMQTPFEPSYHVMSHVVSEIITTNQLIGRRPCPRDIQRPSESGVKSRIASFLEAEAFPIDANGRFGLNVLGMSPFLQQIAIGCILVAAVFSMMFG